MTKQPEKPARKRIQSAKERFFDLSSGLLCIANIEGYFEQISPLFEEVLGFTQEELLESPFLEFVHEDDVVATQAKLENLTFGDAIFTFENRWRCKDGRYKWLSWTASPVTEEGVIFAIAHDINELKLTQTDLQDQITRTQAIVNTAVDAIITIDGNGIIESVNHATMQMFGYDEDDLCGQNVKMLMPSPLREEHDTYLGNYHRTGEARVIGIGRETLGQHKDGTIFPIDLAVSEVHLKDKRLFTGIIRDITERKHAEEKQAKLLQELETANQELQDFAYIVSHDLKAPLRGIRSLADWLESDYTDVLDEDGRELLSLMQRRVTRLQDFIEGILRYSRVGRIEDEWEDVDLQTMTENVIGALAVPDHIQITIHDTLPTVHGSRIHLEQLFQNLLSNAIKYMDKAEGHIELFSEHKGDFREFRIKDNGPGIEERYFAKIFQIFQTLTPRDEYESTGIGLTLVKKIVELHGGAVTVESEVGQGTTFIFTIADQGNQQ